MNNEFSISLENGQLVNEYENRYEIRVEPGTDIDLTLVPFGKVINDVSYEWLIQTEQYSFTGLIFGVVFLLSPSFF